MKSFWDKLSKWVSVNKDAVIIIHSFTFDDGTILSPDVAMEIWKEHMIYTHLSEEYDKVCDYNRLLRKENSELVDYIDQLEEINAYNENNSQDKCTDESNSICGGNNKNNGYLS